MFNRVAVENFKGIKCLEMEGLNRISLVSGKNNVGKSSLLEAIFLFMDHNSQDSFLKLSSFRGMSINSMNDIWESLFYQMNMELPIKINMTDESDDYLLTYTKEENYMPYQAEGIPENVMAQFRSAAKSSYALGFRFESDGYKEKGHFFLSNTGLLKQAETSLPGNEIRLMPATQFVNPFLVRDYTALVNGIGKLELSEKKEDIIWVLQLIDPAIEDIITLSLQGIPQLYIRMNGRLFPLHAAGDGVVKLLLLCIAIMERENGLVLIDELETGFHYSMYSKLWEVIDKISYQANCQVIATTHSYELITAIREADVDKHAFSYFRLGFKNDTMNAFCYDYDMLNVALSSDLEVR